MKIRFTKSAKKELKELDKETKKKVNEEINLLREGKTRIVKLSGLRNEGKIKVGNYRVRYEIEMKDKSILITGVLLRKDAYRNL
jgi:mRNA interferase RelE/StbE